MMEKKYIIVLSREEIGIVEDLLLDAKVECESKAWDMMHKDDSCQAMAKDWKREAEEFESLFFKFFHAKRKQNTVLLKADGLPYLYQEEP